MLDSVIVRVLTARVAQHNAGRFEDLLRQQLPKMREHEGLVYVKLARQANGAFEEVLLFEEWRDAARSTAWAGDELSRPRLMPGAEALAENVHVTHYEALDVDPDSLVAVPIGAAQRRDAGLTRRRVRLRSGAAPPRVGQPRSTGMPGSGRGPAAG